MYIFQSINKKKTNNPIEKNGQKTWIGISQKTKKYIKKMLKYINF